MIDDLVKYKQWVCTDRSNLEVHEDDFDDFLINLLQCFFELTEHHFIAKKQNEFLRVKKASLKFDEAVLIFFLSGFSFTDTDNSLDSRGRKGNIFLLHSTTSSRSRTFRNLFCNFAREMNIKYV